MEGSAAKNAISGGNVKHFNTIKTFFNFGTAEQHQTALARWKTLLLDPGWQREFTEPADLVFRYQHFVSLYEAAWGMFTEATEHKLNTVHNEALFKTFASVFAEQNLEAYKEQLFDWLTDALSNSTVVEGDAQLEPLYTNTMELISAGWRLVAATQPVTLTENRPELAGRLISMAAIIVPVACTLLEEADAQCKNREYYGIYRGQQQLLDETRILLQRATANLGSISALLPAPVYELNKDVAVATNEDWF